MNENFMKRMKNDDDIKMKFRMKLTNKNYH